jgi:hypothetical protein
MVMGEISKLAMECVAFVPSNSPKMKQVVTPLLNLFAVLSMLMILASSRCSAVMINFFRNAA